MNVVILHSEIGSCASADEQDVLTQVEAVSEALRTMGHRTVALPFCLDLPSLSERLRFESCDFVFNLVETGGGQGRLIHLAPAFLDFLQPALFRGRNGGHLSHFEQTGRKTIPSRPSSPHTGLGQPHGILLETLFSRRRPLHRQIGMGACLRRPRRRLGRSSRGHERAPP